MEINQYSSKAIGKVDAKQTSYFNTCDCSARVLSGDKQRRKPQIYLQHVKCSYLNKAQQGSRGAYGTAVHVEV